MLWFVLIFLKCLLRRGLTVFCLLKRSNSGLLIRIQGFVFFPVTKERIVGGERGFLLLVEFYFEKGQEILRKGEKFLLWLSPLTLQQTPNNTLGIFFCQCTCVNLYSLPRCLSLCLFQKLTMRQMPKPTGSCHLVLMFILCEYKGVFWNIINKRRW